MYIYIYIHCHIYIYSISYHITLCYVGQAPMSLGMETTRTNIILCWPCADELPQWGLRHGRKKKTCIYIYIYVYIYIYRYIHICIYTIKYYNILWHVIIWYPLGRRTWPRAIAMFNHYVLLLLSLSVLLFGMSHVRFVGKGLDSAVP